MQTSGVKLITCLRNEEVRLIDFDKEIKFPLFVSVNLLLTSPKEETPPEPSKTETDL